MAITFTNKAAKEMRERIDQDFQSDRTFNRPVSISERPFVSTFHSLGVHILREQSTKIGIKRHFAIFDREDSKRAIKETLLTLGLDPKTVDPSRIISVISKEKGRGVDFKSFNEKGERSYFSKVVAQVWPEYEKTLLRDNALDFDDLLIKTMNLLSENPDVRRFYQNVWQYVHIDEYQDTNRAQYEISKMLVGENENICVVGDIDQNIYSWRGADIKNILDFERDYPKAQVITLEENYRSTKTILEAANTVIEKNKIRVKKNLFTANPQGEKIKIFGGFDEISEAQFVAGETATLIKKGVSPGEIAVLYRANFQSRVLEEAFMSRSIPYQLIGTRFFERKEVKDIISYLRAALNPDSLSDKRRILNVPARGIGKTTMLKIFSGNESSLPLAMKTKLENFKNLLEKIRESSKQNKPSETITLIIKISGLENEWKESGDEGAARLENAYELSNFASRYNDQSPEEGILNFLADAALQSDQDEMRDDGKAVRLMTVHASKGLEFDTVFITGLEEGLFPHQRMSETNTSPEEEEEERRLFYVALTRARKKIFLSYAETRTVFGRRQINMPSGFIFDIPESLVEIEVLGPGSEQKRPLLEIDF
ncbi:MAG: ATP-dependent DNA helicase PcrA [Candidatus Zambryskibacteria bacterium CG22_combo_CG10-13_8_21_14_all_42_17]|uniref:DNA 3'-5' helicase n=1 Tax=Candidatus Zambryskibacteria bacterium CG22_combo_CG10-13_8_21_14_all_42_17 TaxID=1975118 RepID=A0A2H0BFX5_9BACT|nr:MAG: ATP-dependent DNA helicase PcrA [Candidatus Zambryskibacteria bacterium CG22_combo_CG10-13_8_21_14_all_42_17]